MNRTESRMRPVRRYERVQVVDILRGFSLLGVLLMNMNGFSGYEVPTERLGGFSTAATMLINFFVTGKFFTLFSFLFGWGMGIQMERAEQRGQRFAPVYLRRLLALMLIGFAHGVLLWDGDILFLYALLGFPLFFMRKVSDRSLLLLVAIGLLIPVLFSCPGPPMNIRQGYRELTEPFLDRMVEGYQANVYGQGTYWQVVQHHLNSFVFGTLQIPFYGTHVLAMFFLGLWAQRKHLLRDCADHLSFFRRVLRVGLHVGFLLAGVFVYVSMWGEAIPEDYRMLVFRIAYVGGGVALCMAYISLIVLLIQREAWLERLVPLAAIGRMPLTNYLLHSVILTPFFYGYGLGLYGSLAPSITILMTFAIYRAQIGLSNWWMSRFRFGPAEWLWRSLTYLKLQPMRLNPVRRPPPTSDAASIAPTNGHLMNRSIRRVVFLLFLLPSLVFFIALAMYLGQMGGWSAVLRALPAATNFTEEYLVNVLHGDLGEVQTVTSTVTRPVAGQVARALPRSLGLLFVSLVLAILIGLPLGIFAALRRKTRLSGLVVFLSVLGISTPSYFAAMLLIWFNVWLYRRTGADLVPIHGFGWDAHLVMPALVLAARPAANVMRLGYNALSEVLDADYVRTAHAKGLRPRIVLLRHVLRSAGVPLLTTVAVSLRFSLAVLPIVEYIFNWSGVGQMLLEAIDFQDITTVVGMVLPLAVLFVFVNLLLEVLYRLVDPRLRSGEVKAA